MDGIFTQGHAIIVGVGADLPNTIDDATGLANILKDPERCAYPPEQVHLLTGPQATSTSILSALDSLAQSSTPQSTVIIYFSGHGYRAATAVGQGYYLIPYGYDIEQLDQTTISGTDFISRLRAIQAQKLLVLLDCCHAGGIDDAKAPGLQLAKVPLPPETQTLLERGSGRVIIASSMGNELSYAGKPYSAFTLALIEALSGVGASQQDGYVRVADLALHTREVVPQRTKNRQHPILNFEQADNFVLAYYSGGNTHPKGLPFSGEPRIEPEPGAWTAFDQRDQSVQGPQTNLIGNLQAPILSGTFQAPVRTGGSDTIHVAGNYQPNWTVGGNVNHAQRDLIMAKRDVRLAGAHLPDEGETLTRVFASFLEGVHSLPAGDQPVVRALVEQARDQAMKIQQGDRNLETQVDFERRLKSLRVLTPDLADAALTTLAQPVAGSAPAIQTIARKVLEG